MFQGFRDVGLAVLVLMFKLKGYALWNYCVGLGVRNVKSLSFSATPAKLPPPGSPPDQPYLGLTKAH